MQDFKDNAKKRHVVYRARGSEWHEKNAPRQFYFIVPFALITKVQPLLLPRAGLLFLPNAFQKQEAHVIVKSPVNSKAVRLSLSDCAKASALQTNMVLAQHRKIDELKHRLKTYEQTKK